MWRKVRIGILLLILLFVALNTWFDRVYSTDWRNPLRVAIFPVNGDGSAASARHMQGLQSDHLLPLELFFAEEGKAYGVHTAPPIRFSLAAPISELPPQLDPDTGRLGVMWWSLRARWWASRAEGPPGNEVKLFVLYHDPQRTSSLPHSTGLQKGLFGIVHVFADQRMAGSNDTVIAHELLHTLGASDKYGPDNLPRFPDGYADPERQPRYPQEFAELMGGRIPLSATEAEIPESLQQVVIGPATAAEIGWTRR